METGLVKMLADYGALGVLIAALIWMLRYLLAKLPQIIENNTRAMTELTESLRGKVVDCPYRRLGAEEVSQHGDAVRR